VCHRCWLGQQSVGQRTLAVCISLGPLATNRDVPSDKGDSMPRIVAPSNIEWTTLLHYPQRSRRGGPHVTERPSSVWNRPNYLDPPVRHMRVCPLASRIPILAQNSDSSSWRRRMRVLSNWFRSGRVSSRFPSVRRPMLGRAGYHQLVSKWEFGWQCVPVGPFASIRRHGLEVSSYSRAKASPK